MIARIYYQKQFGSHIHYEGEPEPVIFGETHQLVAVHHLADMEIEDALHACYRFFQGEVWSPNGEARELIRGLGLMHTSMSMGDVISFVDCYDPETHWMVSSGFGFEKITPEDPKDHSRPPTRNEITKAFTETNWEEVEDHSGDYPRNK